MIWTDITLEVYQSKLILSVRVFDSDLYNIQKREMHMSGIEEIETEVNTCTEKSVL
jgi:hypothetical protein